MDSELKQKMAEAIIECAAKQRASGALSYDLLVEEFISEKPGLWEEAREPLAKDRLVALARLLLNQRPPEASQQLTLPGFEPLPAMLRINRTWVDLKRTPIPDLRTYVHAESERLKVTWHRFTERLRTQRRRLDELRKLVRATRFYVRTEPQITVEAALRDRDRPVQGRRRKRATI